MTNSWPSRRSKLEDTVVPVDGDAAHGQAVCLSRGLGSWSVMVPRHYRRVPRHRNGRPAPQTATAR